MSMVAAGTHDKSHARWCARRQAQPKRAGDAYTRKLTRAIGIDPRRRSQPAQCHVQSSWMQRISPLHNAAAGARAGILRVLTHGTGTPGTCDWYPTTQCGGRHVRELAGRTGSDGKGPAVPMLRSDPAGRRSCTPPLAPTAEQAACRDSPAVARAARRTSDAAWAHSGARAGGIRGGCRELQAQGRTGNASSRQHRSHTCARRSEPSRRIRCSWSPGSAAPKGAGT